MVGTKLGPYRILEQLGKGGMGEVWLAEDTRLHRKVAVKVLPAELAGDVDRRQRFEQEARAAAALNHPNIAAIHDVGVEPGTAIADRAGADAGTADRPATHYIVQEHLEGETLRDALARGPLAFDKALTLATEIGEGLKAAHRAGIVHRDLKPENIFVTRDGHAKVLDFGLAKLTEMALAPGGGPSMSPTMTMAGVVLGTAGYMSPEQVRGEEVDERADLFALGCVLYEMITGKQAFGGGNVHESLSRILSGEPDAIGSGSGSTVQFGWLLDKLLAKDRDARYQSAADVVVDLRRLAGSGESGGFGALAAASAGTPGTSPPGPAVRRSPIGIAVVAVAALVLGAVGAWMLKPSAQTSAAAPDVRFEMMLPLNRGFSANYNRVVTISPDGRTVAYMAEGLMVRALDDTRPRAIPGTADARSPAFSSDSRQIAFWDSGHVKRAEVAGGVPIVVGPLHERPNGMHWAADGYIYVGRSNQGIWRMPASGGEPEQLIVLEDGEYAHGPEPLPDGEWILFTLCRSVRGWADASIVAQSLSTRERRVLIERGQEVRVTDNGYLTYVHDNTLFAAPFDAGRVEVVGGAVAMETNVHTSASDETGAAGYDVSDDGVLVFAPPSGFGARDARLTFLDADGRETVLPMDARRYGAAKLSPDGKRVAAQINDIEGTHVWILPVDRGGAQRLTTVGRNTSPVWSHDGRTVYFASDRDGDTDIWRRPADLSAAAEKVFASDGAELPTSVSGDGRWLMYSRMSPGNSDIGRVSLAGDPTEEILVETPADELNGELSPDGRFFCFQSDETGRWDIHVMEIATGRRWIVSTADGFFPLWTRDGKRIYYMSGAESFNRVDVRTDPKFEATDPVLAVRIDAGRMGTTFDVTHDGSRVLAAANETGDDSEETRPRVTVVLNFFADLDARTKGDIPL